MADREKSGRSDEERRATDEAFQPPTGHIDKSAGGPVFEPPSCDELTKALEGIEVTQFIGQGGMGTVYSGNQPAFDRRVAIKILPTKGEEAARYANRFKQEAQAMARINHNGIVGVHEYGISRDEKWHYITMEYVHGDILSRLLEKLSFNQVQILAIITQICDAIYYAHEHGIVHRNIKPSNILLDINGQVKIADFGLAKSLGQEFGQTVMGAANTAGATDFVAPEQLEEGRRVDHRADIYSIGVIMYRMLTGKIPRGAFQPPSKAVDGIDPRLDNVVAKAMNADPDERFQNIAELWREVERIGSGPPAPDVAFEERSDEPKVPSVAGVTPPPTLSLQTARVEIRAEDGKFREVSVRPVASADVVRDRSPLVALSLIFFLGCLGFFGFVLYRDHLRESPTYGPGSPSGPVAEAGRGASESEHGKDAAPDTGVNRPAGMSYVPFESRPEGLPPIGSEREEGAISAKGNPGKAARGGKPKGEPAPSPETAAAAAGVGSDAITFPEPAPAPTPVATPKAMSEIEKTVEGIVSKFEGVYRDTVEKEFSAAVADLNTKYEAALAREQARVVQEADLEGAVALRDELAALGAAGTTALVAPLAADAPEVLVKLRGTYQGEIVKFEAVRAAGVERVRARIDPALDEIQKDLTRKGQLDEALEVKSAREQLRGSLSVFPRPGQ